MIHEKLNIKELKPTVIRLRKEFYTAQQIAEKLEISLHTYFKVLKEIENEK